jgi:hypothetical protein
VEEVGSSGRLDALCAAVVGAFKDAGLLIKARAGGGALWSPRPNGSHCGLKSLGLPHWRRSHRGPATHAHALAPWGGPSSWPQGEREAVKIHATVINSRHRAGVGGGAAEEAPGGGGGGGGGGRGRGGGRGGRGGGGGGGGGGRGRGGGGRGSEPQQQRVPFDGRDLFGGPLGEGLGEPRGWVGGERSCLDWAPVPCRLIAPP